MEQKTIRFRNAFTALANTNLTTVYTCPLNIVGVIKEIIVCNVDGSASADITLKITDTSASTTFSIVSTKAVANGDILKAQASAGDDLEVSVFVEEHYDPTR